MTTRRQILIISTVHQVLKNYRQSLGKETKPYHYINETRLIRYAVSGDCNAILDFKNPSRQLQRLQRRVICLNCRLIESHIEFKIRKQACRDLVIKHKFTLQNGDSNA
jgi:uncharacterized protein (UPF0297 family)